MFRRGGCKLCMRGGLLLDQKRRHLHGPPVLLPCLLGSAQSIQGYTERRVLELLGGALPWPSETIDVDDVVVFACLLADQSFEKALKKDVFDVSLFAPRVVGELNHVIPLLRHRMEELPGI